MKFELGYKNDQGQESYFVKAGSQQEKIAVIMCSSAATGKKLDNLGSVSWNTDGIIVAGAEFADHNWLADDD